ncbi:MAG: hypothetical protein N2259_01825 [Patescibacteria group bacterium]|nr:hypothetical protein [Patescibacteria group bacterium]
MTIVYLILIFLFSFVLVKGADLTIKSLKKIGAIFRWSPFVLSFIFVGVATSLPEIFIGLTSAFHQIPTLSLGNVIGANIVNLTLILGLTAIIVSKIKLRGAIKGQTFFSLIASFYPVLLALDGKLSRLDGLALITLFIIYLVFLFFQDKDYLLKLPSEEKNRHLFKNFIFLFFGLILLIGSAEIIVKITQILAISLKLSLILIGLILISLSTTLPELAFGLRAALKRQEELSLGNSLGTIVVNSCLALGLAAIIFPIEIITFSTFLIGALFFLFVLIIFTVFIKSRDELSWTEGIFLVLFFIVFLTVQFLLSR